MKNFVQTGDNLTFAASELVHPAHAAGDTYTNLVAPGLGVAVPVTLVESGDAVVVGQIVGVANQDAINATDLVVVSTRGVFNLSVAGTDNLGNSAVAKGDHIYIDGATALLTKDSTKTLFGVALGTVALGATAVIPVRITNH